jgi:hypothetical protein
MSEIKLNYQVPTEYNFDKGQDGYTLHQCDYIADNLLDIFEDLRVAHNNFKKLFPNEDSTWAYSKYNIFALTAPSTNFYKIYVELRNVIRTQLGTDKPLWLEAWINYHKHDEVLDWHHHDFDYHGYISIDPKQSNTVFENYSIKNKPGQIYFGPGHRLHKVEVLEPFEGVRTTIGFDVHTIPDSPLIRNYVERPFVNMSLIPLL